VDEIISSYEPILRKCLLFNPKLKVVFTVSPIRHTKDGIATNSLSKSTLVCAIHQLILRQKEFLPVIQSTDEPVLSYFPSYEYMIDDLRYDAMCCAIFLFFSSAIFLEIIVIMKKI
jgi:hypothetical protein